MKRTLTALMVFAMIGSLMFVGMAGTAAAQNDTDGDSVIGIGGDGGDGGDAVHEGHDVDVDTGPAIVDQSQDATNSNTQAASSSSPADNPNHNKYDDGGDAGPSQFQNVNQQTDQTQTGIADSSAEVGDVSGDANAGDGGDGGDANVDVTEETTTDDGADDGADDGGADDGGADDGGADDGGDDGTLDDISATVDEILELLELNLDVGL